MTGLRERRRFVRERAARGPGLSAAVLADTRVSSAYRGRPLAGASRRQVLLEAGRLAWRSDAFAAQLAYRLRTRLLARGVPILPRLLHRFSMSVAQVSIGDPVIIAPGMYLPHGQVVIDGITEIGPETRILPWTTIGLRDGELTGPTLEGRTMVGTGAKLLGPIEIGSGVKVGANAVVLGDVPDGATAVGVPARILTGERSPEG